MVRRRLVLAWLATAAVAHGKEIKRIHGDDPSIYEDRVMSESDRVAKFHELHGEWPDPRWLARETPGYTRRMAEREADIMADATTSQARWDQWMFLVQARMLPTFTPKQWTKTKAPADVYERLITRFREKIQSATRESMSQDLSGVLGPEHALFFEQEELNYEILHELLPLHEAWAGIELEPTSVYGVRVYQNGSTLVDHLDVLETHVISSILHIDSDLDEPYPIEVEDVTGTRATVNLEPGTMVFYESAKAFHQRSRPMVGRYYASIFMHYRPKHMAKDWPYSRGQVKVAIPPHWRNGLQEERESAPPQVSNDAARSVDFVDSRGETLVHKEGEASLFWVNTQDGSEVPFGTLPWRKGKETEHLTLTTYNGHVWLMRSADGTELQRHVIQPHSPNVVLTGHRDEL